MDIILVRFLLTHYDSQKHEHFPLTETGASQLIGEGKIKLKNDSKISHFTERTLVFDNGSELEADVVIFATG